MFFLNGPVLLSILSMSKGQNGLSPILSVIQPVTTDTMLNNNLLFFFLKNVTCKKFLAEFTARSQGWFSPTVGLDFSGQLHN